MNTTTTSIEQLKNQYHGARRTSERFQAEIAKKLGWSTYYEIRPVDLTPELIEKLSQEDVDKLERLYNNERELYWRVHGLEAAQKNTIKEHVAAKKAYDWIDSFPCMVVNQILREHGLTSFSLISKLVDNPNFIEEVLL